MPDGKAAVWRTRDGGDTWQALREGLPQENAFFGVLRQAMATDPLEPAGVYFGTSSGTLYASADEGDSWTLIAQHLPTILRWRRWSSTRRQAGGHRPSMRRRCDRSVSCQPAGVLVDLFPGVAAAGRGGRATVARDDRRARRALAGHARPLCDSTPRIRRHINVFVDGERARAGDPAAPGRGGVRPDGDQRRLTALTDPDFLRMASLSCALARWSNLN